MKIPKFQTQRNFTRYIAAALIYHLNAVVGMQCIVYKYTRVLLVLGNLSEIQHTFQLFIKRNVCCSFPSVCVSIVLCLTLCVRSFFLLPLYADGKLSAQFDATAK